MTLSSILKPIKWTHYRFVDVILYIDDTDLFWLFRYTAYLLLAGLYLIVMYHLFLYYFPVALAVFGIIWLFRRFYFVNPLLDFSKEDKIVDDLKEDLEKIDTDYKNEVKNIAAEFRGLKLTIEQCRHALAKKDKLLNEANDLIEKQGHFIEKLKARLDILESDHASNDVLELCRQMLGVDRHTNPESLRSAYYAKAKKIHPDHRGDDDLMRALNQAYDILKAPHK